MHLNKVQLAHGKLVNHHYHKYIRISWIILAQ